MKETQLITIRTVSIWARFRITYTENVDMTNRSKHILITLFAIVALAMSAIPACACSHHLPKAENQVDVASCHSHGDAGSASGVMAPSSALSRTDDCVCATVHVVSYDTSTTAKIKKTPAIVTQKLADQLVPVTSTDQENELTARVLDVAGVSFNIPLHRGPPRL